GFNDFLSKPIEISKLNEIIERWIPMEKRTANKRQERDSGSQTEIGFEIEGVNASRGLAMTGGTVERYFGVLELYCRDAEKRIAVLRKIPGKSELSAFVTQVHALKSASASIGAEEISRMAAELEEAGRNGDMEFIRANLGVFIENLAAATERIKAALSGKAVISHDEKRQGLGEPLSLLKDALASENVGDADKILADLSGGPLDKATKDSLSRISDLVLVGEFEEASAIAENLSE
ncbi:MAG: Hpt domain-containing protein, partial [Synergistaceae bacterium]|nr:Hpt domain-containing protein [Synergistaceae bacterium]